MRIGVKYCGGCNPRYDRTGLVAQLINKLGGEGLEWVVCGCTAACAEHQSLNGARGKLVIHAQEQYAAALERLKQLRQVP